MVWMDTITPIWVKEVMEVLEEGPIIEVITEAAAIQARSNITIPLQPGPFKSGNGGKGGKSGKSIGQWQGEKGGTGRMVGRRILFGTFQRKVG